MTVVFRVLEPGLATSIQDLGRPHAVASGVPAGGAMDRFAHRAANLLVGNEAGAATLECTLTGPHLVAERPILVAIAGADLDPSVNGHSVPGWTGLLLGAGDHLRFGKRRSGARAYLAVAGGFAGERWLGSLATYAVANRGGLHGRILVAGDEIASAADPVGPSVSGRDVPPQRQPDYGSGVLHAVPGPHLSRLDPMGRHLLFNSTFTVSRNADRMGYRLEGPSLEVSGDELLSFGLTVGALQVPARGQPILLMADHQTAGGYPVAATVVGASLPVAAQLAPGDPVRFAEITVERALHMRRDLAAALATLRD